MVSKADAVLSIDGGSNQTLTFGDNSNTLRLTANAGNPGIDPKWAWKSSDPDVASVEFSYMEEDTEKNECLVTIHKAGTALIYVNYESNISQNPVDTVYCQLDINGTDTEASFEEGDWLSVIYGENNNTLTLHPIAADPGTNGKWSWSISDENVASVDENGVVTIHSVGSVNINASYRSDTTQGSAWISLYIEYPIIYVNTADSSEGWIEPGTMGGWINPNQTSYMPSSLPIELFEPWYNDEGSPDKSFAAWYDNPEYEGDPVTVIPEGSSGSITLYALWNIPEATTTPEVTTTPEATITPEPDEPSVTTNTTSDLDDSNLPESIDEETLTAISSNTEVSGVKLSSGTDNSSVNSIIAQAIEGSGSLPAAQAAEAIRNASEIKIEIKVTITPKQFEAGTSISFELNPAAILKTMNEEGNQTAEIGGLRVTNEMLDQQQPITVTIYTGFKPQQIIHYDSNGNVIEKFEEKDIIYNEAAKTSTVTIYHFSTLQANLTPYYTVSFDTNGGSQIESQEILSGSTAVRPDDPTRDNFIFINWYADPSLSSIYDFNTPVRAEITLYAGWNAVEPPENPEEPIDPITKPEDITFINIKKDGSYKTPSDIDETNFSLTIEVIAGETVLRHAKDVQLTVKPDVKEIPLKNIPFSVLNREETAGSDSALRIRVTEFPKGPINGFETIHDSSTGTDVRKIKNQYTVSVYEVRPYKNGTITVYLLWDDGSSPVEEIRVVALPEDEIGAYSLRADGTKEYLIFQTYDICMAWLGSDELCAGPERCYHK